MRCVLWMIQIDEVLMDDENCEALVTHIDHLLITCTLQLRVTYSKHMSLYVDSTAGSAQQHQVLSLYKCLLATFHSVSRCIHTILFGICTSDQCSDCVLWCNGYVHNQTSDQSDVLKFAHSRELHGDAGWMGMGTAVCRQWTVFLICSLYILS